jgi:hypothetical protein
MPDPVQRFITHCRFCSRTWKLNDLSVPIVGEQKTIQERLVGFVELLTAHLQEAHPEELIGVTAAVRDVCGLEILGRFTHEEPRLLTVMNEIRKAFHRTMQPTPPSDSLIEEQIVRLSLANGDQQKVIDLFKMFRNEWLEIPVQAENPLLVLP